MPSKYFELTEDDFERFRKLINQTSGIFFDWGKRDLLRLGLTGSRRCGRRRDSC